MKQSILLSIVIFVLGLIPGFLQQKRREPIHGEIEKLTAEAVRLGVAPDGALSPTDQRTNKRQREARDQQTRSFTSGLIAFAKETDANEKNGKEQDSEMRKRMMDMMEKLAVLNPAQIKDVIAELRDSNDLSKEMRGNIISFAIMTLSDDHPEAAVELFSDSADLLTKSMLGEHVISSALNRWATMDPDAALAWVRNHPEGAPGMTGDDAKRGVISGISEKNPKLAFQLIHDLDVDDPAGAITTVVVTGHDSPEQRNAVLAALRGYLSGIQDPAEREELSSKALEMFARTAEKDSFESLTKWMGDSNFTPQEKEQIAGGLSYFTTKQDTGRWVEWMAGNLSAENISAPVREIVGEWTQQDYVSAGKWLTTAADGPAKTAAVSAYAEAVAEYEPQIAAQWALTLPAGPSRDATLRAVYQNWPPSDPQGAAAFAREHGLE